MHHGLPEEKELRDWFTKRGIDVNSGEYLYDLPKDIHRLKEGNGIHTNNSPLGEEWNSAWKHYKVQNPYATKSQIIDQLHKMAKDAGIESYQAIKK